MPLPKYIDAAEQAAKKVQQARDKAVKQEYKTEQTLSNAQHKHDRAVVNKKKVEHDLSVFPHQIDYGRSSRISPLVSVSQVQQRHLQEVRQTVEGRRAEVERAQREKDAGDVGFKLRPSC